MPSSVVKVNFPNNNVLEMESVSITPPLLNTATSKKCLSTVGVESQTSCSGVEEMGHKK
jgi:hypothetical protein